MNRFARNGRDRVRKAYLSIIALPLLLGAGVAHAQYGYNPGRQYQSGGQYQPGQYPLLDKAANKVIEKYQNSSCDELWQSRDQPPSEQKQRAIQFLRSDPQIRQMFINMVAGPVANKLFECGMIP